MRWLYPDPANKAESRKRKAIESAMADWWRHFASAAPTMDKAFSGAGGDFDLVAFMRKHLGKVHLEIMWEFGPAVKTKGHRLVFSPESRHELAPIVRSLVACAPKLPGWEFYAYRLAEDLQQSAATVHARVGGDLAGASVKLSQGESNLVDVVYHFPDPPGDADDVRAAAFVATDCLLGEENSLLRVGVIDVEAKKGSRGWLALDRMKPTFDALVASMRDRLPDKPVYHDAESAKWYQFKREAEDAEDYAGMSDAFVGTTLIGEALPALFGGRVFASERFSRLGETHAYLKLDFQDVPRPKFIETRSRFEDAVLPALARKGLGGLWGTAGGVRYAYLLLALTDVPKAAGVIGEVLRGAKAPKRSWLQFCDARLASEWIGVYPNSPAPPMPQEE
ncbi:MAG: hypothetical protein KF754_12520 [Planctomycetes bacterium]|nr:hypothetical protein [Planctomycetota bacterium]